jgi:O-antigen/teichoic acid export membrane protein
VALARPAAALFAFFPLVVMVRAYYHGVGLLEHRTRALAPSAPARIAAILLALVLLPLLGIQGATRGIAALVCGFGCEAVVAWWGVRGRARFPGKAKALHTSWRQ